MTISRIAAILALTISPALAAPPPPTAQRVRGTIAASDAQTLTVHQLDGTNVKLLVNADTHYAAVVASDLKAVQPGSFIGTATKGFGAHMTALEVVVFPPELRGQGEGHYGWDKLPEAGGGTVASSMTNGTVQAPGTKLVASSMTNGNIDAVSQKDGAQKNGALRITVTYKGGKKDIVVPPTTAIVAFKLATAAIVKPGAPAFIVAIPSGATLQAKFVAVGQDGVKPPM